MKTNLVTVLKKNIETANDLIKKMNQVSEILEGSYNLNESILKVSKIKAELEVYYRIFRRLSSIEELDLEALYPNESPSKYICELKYAHELTRDYFRNSESHKNILEVIEIVNADVAIGSGLEWIDNVFNMYYAEVLEMQ